MRRGIKDVKAKFADAETLDSFDLEVQTGGYSYDHRPPPDLEEPEEPERKAASFPLNDVGNGHRIVTYFGDELLHVPRVGWFVWDGRQWAKDPDELQVRSLGQTLAARIEAEIPFVALEDWQRDLLAAIPGLKQSIAEIDAIDAKARTQEQSEERLKLISRLNLAEKQRDALSDKRSAHRSFAKTSGNSDRIKKAQGEAGVMLSRSLDELDADALAVNVANGVLRFSVTRMDGAGRVADMRLEPHSREALQTKLINADYDPDAEAPLFHEFLERVQPDQVMRDFLQRWFGLCMTGITGEQKLAFLYGHGANGKSVLVDTIWGLMGDYAATAKIESLTGQTKRGGADATPDLIPLMGARAVRASEPEQGERLKEGTIKELTGGEPILVRQLHADFVEVKPEFKLTISGNYKPEIRGTDDGIWRRLLLVPFDVQIPPAERDPDLGRKLALEAPGILKWMADGLFDYLESGLQEPDRVLEATKEYRADSDPVGTFLTECTTVTGDADDFMLSRDLIDAFNFWNIQREGTEWGGRTISNHLKGKSSHWRHPATGQCFAPAKRKATGYRGIKLTDTFKHDFDQRPHGRGYQTSKAREEEPDL